jgi:Zn-dependent metalloprotease
MEKNIIGLVALMILLVAIVGSAPKAIAVLDNTVVDETSIDPIPIDPEPTPYDVFTDAQTGKVIFLKVNADSNKASLITQETSETAASTAMSFLEANKAVFGITDTNTELIQGQIEQDALGMTHITYLQKYQNLQVLGTELKVHLDRYGRVYAVSSNFADSITLGTTPAITADDAKNIAIARWQSGFPINIQPEMEVSGLIIFPKNIIDNNGRDDTYLTYPVRIYLERDDGAIYTDDTYYVDAENGDVIQKMSNLRQYGTCPTANASIWPCRRVYDCDTFPNNSSCGIDYNVSAYPTYYFGRSEGRPTRGPDPRPNPPSMFGGSNNTDQLFNLFMNVHKYYNYTYNRWGANKKGGSSWGANDNYTRGFTHLDMAPIGLINCPGGHAWFAGSNQAIHFCLNTVVPEMIGHEYAHAVLFYEFFNATGWPVGPLYYGETGALDESHSDLEGEFLERDYFNGTHNWIIGGYAPMNWSRNMMKPESTVNSVNGLPYPNRFFDPNFYCGTDDNAGVHVGLSVPSKAAYMTSVGESFNGCTINAIGENATQQIIYRAWDIYTTSTESFNAFVVHTNQACQDLYASTHPEYCTALAKAYQAVEMDQAGKCSNQTEQAPICAVKNAGTVYTMKINGIQSLNFTPAETVYLGATNGTAGKIVNVHVIKQNGSYSNWAQIKSMINVTTTILPNGKINMSLGVINETGTYDVIVDADRDGYYLSWADSTTSFLVNIPLVNGPPTVTLGSSNQTVIAGQPFTVLLTGSSPYTLASVWWGVRDVNNLTFHNISGSVDGVAVNLAAAQGFGMCYGMTYCQFSRVVIISNPGSYEIWANSRDVLYPVPGEPHQASEGLGLAVVSTNVNPAFLAMPARKLVSVGEPVSFDISAQDQNGDILKLEMIQGLPGATFVPSTTIINPDGTSSITGSFKWIPSSKQIGTYTVQFKATDSKGGVTLSKPVQIKVANIVLSVSDIE